MKRMLVFISLCLIFSSCASKQPSNENAATVKLRTQGKAGAIDSKYHAENGKVWIPAERAAESVHYRYVWKPERQTAWMGYTDPIYELTANVKQAKVGNEEIELGEAPKVIDGTLYIESSSLSQLWNTPVTWDGKEGTVFVAASNDSFWDDFLINPYTPLTPEAGATPPAAEPAPPPRAAAPTTPPERREPSAPTAPSERTTPSAPTEASGKAAELIEFAKTFMGTPYDFGSGPYSETHKFDCSSFVQHVFKHEGIDLPRSSQSQASTGKSVDRNDLQPGDLVFFNTPGRFSSDRMVGHVAIYMGNGQIIHTYGDPGVTTSDLNDESWSKRYLHARREL